MRYAELAAGENLIAIGQQRGALQAHPHRVDALDHPVVKVAGNTLAIVEHAHDADAVVKPRRENGRVLVSPITSDVRRGSALPPAGVFARAHWTRTDPAATFACATP